MARFSTGALVLALLIFSCSLDYSEADLTEELSEETPDMIIYQYESVDIRDGSPVLKITAEEAEFYNSREETLLSNVEFNNYEDDEISTRGETERAVLHMKSGDASLSGTIVIESVDDDSSLEAETLYWVDSEKTLTSEKTDTVTVVDKEGSTLKGHGFSADIKKSSINFDGEIEGEFVSED